MKTTTRLENEDDISLKNYENEDHWYHYKLGDEENRYETGTEDQVWNMDKKVKRHFKVW